MLQQLESLVQDNSSDVFDLSAQMVQLEAVQRAVASLMERIDEIIYKSWHEDSGLAFLSILEIKRIVRLIDLGFYPLYTIMKEKVVSLEGISNEIFEIVIHQKNTPQMISKSENDNCSNLNN